MKTLIEIADVTMRFGAVTAVDHVSLNISAGSVHAITGENGAGKSTLMKLLAGVISPTSGEIRLEGRPVHFKSPADALKHGISTVFQEFTLIPNLTVAENIFLGREYMSAGAVDYARLNRSAASALKRLGADIEPGELARNLTVAQQQMVEIAKGVSADAGVFIFDEPTAALNTADVDKLKAVIADLKAAGKTILYISHRLEEIFSICDTVSVMKDGRHVLVRPTSELTERELIGYMVGREISEYFPERASELGEPVLEVRGLRSAKMESGVDFSLRRHEILGLAGLEGQGQREIVRMIAGIEPALAGGVRKATAAGSFASLPIHCGVRPILASNIGFVPEDRKGEGLFLDLPIETNIALGLESLKRPWQPKARTKSIIERMMSRMAIRAPDAQVDVGALSGGNQQKVLIARWLAADMNVLLIEEPTRGVDVGAKAEVYWLLREFTKSGGAVLLVSRELSELIGLCDRLLVVHDNKIVAELAAEGATESGILHEAIGIKGEGA